MCCGMTLIIVSSGIVAEADCGPENTISPAKCNPAYYVPWDSPGRCDPWLWWCYDNPTNPCSAATGQGFAVEGVCENVISGSTYKTCSTGYAVALFEVHPMYSQCVVEYTVCRCKEFADMNVTYTEGACDCW